VGGDRALRIGVLALQGDVAEHVAAFEAALCERPGDHAPVVPVRHADQLASLDGLAVPGGESTTISRLIEKNRLRRPLLEFAGGLFATCAGMVLAASAVDDPRVRPLGLVEMTVARNAFGRQRESFERDLPVTGLDAPFHAVFIRAPVATRVGPGATVLAALDAGAVAVRQGRHLALSFHPELGTDLRLHHLFLDGL
jgi:pyridoxal 5'-phosphate synthase pdxT subunit